MQQENLHAFCDKMQQQSLPQLVIDTFSHYYQQLISGETGFLTEQDIDPITSEEIANYNDLTPYREVGEKLLPKMAVFKLNGGLGTSMGLQKAKSLLQVKNNLSFLDIVAKQIQALNSKYNTQIPLVLMNSFNTNSDSLLALEKYPDLRIEHFLQHKFPKILQQTLSLPSSTNPNLEWHPPGHGDIYPALITSKMLEKLINDGIHYAFIANIDNLGATVDPQILGYFAKYDFPFMMEATLRTEMDKKGGHLARLKNGRMVLRESAQCPKDQLKQFQQTEKYQYFNTNNIWINLLHLQKVLIERNNILGLPMICNSKHLNPRDKNSTQIYQLETAMGAAISCFENATAICVPRSRFAPVKKCNDLLLLWSDYFILQEDGTIIKNPKRTKTDIMIELDEKYYIHIDQLKQRFPKGAPSLIDCQHLKISGDITFGKNIIIRNNVEISSVDSLTIADDTVFDE